MKLRTNSVKNIEVCPSAQKKECNELATNTQRTGIKRNEWHATKRNTPL